MSKMVWVLLIGGAVSWFAYRMKKMFGYLAAAATLYFAYMARGE